MKSYMGIKIEDGCKSLILLTDRELTDDEMKRHERIHHPTKVGFAVMPGYIIDLLNTTEVTQ